MNPDEIKTINKFISNIWSDNVLTVDKKSEIAQAILLTYSQEDIVSIQCYERSEHGGS
ncbi:TPA: hypothetical protein ACX6S6_001492 [Photobacterium damselae]